jgi:hypothetical protein
MDRIGDDSIYGFCRHLALDNRAAFSFFQGIYESLRIGAVQHPDAAIFEPAA